MKKILLVIFMSLMTQTALAFDNPIADSYGEWVGANSLIVVSKHGLEESYKTNLTEKCFGKEFDIQKLTSISGKKLLKDIDKAIDAPAKYVYDPEVANLEVMKTFINKDQNYKGIFVSSKCGDGYESFVLLSPYTGIYIYSSGGKDYHLIRKRK